LFVNGSANATNINSSNVNTTNIVATTANSNTVNVTTLNSTISNLGAVANVHITGGSTGYVLATDGSGNLSWVYIDPSVSGDGGNASSSVLLLASLDGGNALSS
jgi:hypothetical protein